MDLTARYTGLAAGLGLAVSARNLLDEAYAAPSDGRIPDDYPQEGRSLTVELRYWFP